MREHLAETKEQLRRLNKLLADQGASSSVIKDALLATKRDRNGEFDGQQRSAQKHALPAMHSKPLK
jgi:ferritin-like metal-binding protein YciE